MASLVSVQGFCSTPAVPLLLRPFKSRDISLCCLHWSGPGLSHWDPAKVLEQLLLFTTSGALAKLPNFSKLQCLHLGKPQSQGLSFPCLGSWHASQRKRWVCVLPPSSPPILLLFAMQQTGLAG